VALDTTLSEQSKVQVQGTAHAMDALDTKTEKAIAGLRSELRNDITQLHGELTLVKWMLGILLAGVLSLALKAFF